MKLPSLWSRKPKPEREFIEIELSVPRKAYYQRLGGQPIPCPRCGGELHLSQQTYMVATRQDKRLADSFMTNGDFGWYCTSCPTMVIDMDELGNMLSFSLPDWKIGSEVAVLGIVDLKAIPKEKQHMPLGEDGNPIPLVKFLHPKPERRTKAEPPTESKPSRRTRRGSRRK